jgi:GH43 family beta-xylosidase|tara:strand:- start:2230 stop:3222 length:993 start_codon:yes stop_codon:yes gene_type:complete
VLRQVLFIYCAIISVTGIAMEQKTQFTNPVAPSGADPWVVQEGSFYYYCYSLRGALWVNKRKRLQDAVQHTGRKVWSPPAGKPYSKELWAPELHRIAGKWYIYFAADDGENSNHRMYVLESAAADPLGSYIFRGKIASESDRWAIDGTVLKWRSKLYLIWSGWAGDRNVRQDLYIAPMSDPLRISGKRVLISRPEYEWEKMGTPLVNEGPQALINGNDLFIIYSASGSWTDHYNLGQLRLTGIDPLLPTAWSKTATSVFYGSSSVFSPGHASFTKSPDGKEDWIVYHTAKHPGAGWNRDVCMKRFTWDSKGNPVFGQPSTKGVLMDTPTE